MAIQYDPQISLLKSVVWPKLWKFTSFRVVLYHYEFWVWMLLNISMTFYVVHFDQDTSNFRWEWVAAMQYLNMFILIFYNEHAYSRYSTFYPHCMGALNSSILFVHGMTIDIPPTLGQDVQKIIEGVSAKDCEVKVSYAKNLSAGDEFTAGDLLDEETRVIASVEVDASPGSTGEGTITLEKPLNNNYPRGTEARIYLKHYEEVERYRLASCRYILAAVHLFYMTLTGGVQQGTEWKEVARKGLLTRGEIELIQDYPGGRVTLILASWSMQALNQCLTKKCFWKKLSPHPAHIYNRLNEHTLNVIQSLHKITYLMALPIPYPYFHLLNFVMACNFFLLAATFAAFKTYLAIIPFGFCILVYKGFLEVSRALADPFGQDGLDFPIKYFLDYLFDHSMSLLEAFSNPMTSLRLSKQIEEAVDFTEDELLRLPHTKHLYEFKRKKERDGQFAWEKDMPLAHQEEPLALLKNVLVDTDANKRDEKDKEAKVAEMRAIREKLEGPKLEAIEGPTPEAIEGSSVDAGAGIGPLEPKAEGEEEDTEAAKGENKRVFAEAEVRTEENANIQAAKVLTGVRQQLKIAEARLQSLRTLCGAQGITSSMDELPDPSSPMGQYGTGTADDYVPAAQPVKSARAPLAILAEVPPNPKDRRLMNPGYKPGNEPAGRRHGSPVTNVTNEPAGRRYHSPVTRGTPVGQPQEGDDQVAKAVWGTAPVGGGFGIPPNPNVTWPPKNKGPAPTSTRSRSLPGQERGATNTYGVPVEDLGPDEDMEGSKFESFEQAQMRIRQALSEVREPKPNGQADAEDKDKPRRRRP